MELQEFETLMNQQAGWTFPAEYYESIIEPVYMATGDDKIAFVKFCAEKDLNGIQLLKSDLRMVEHLSGLGMTITQIHAVFRILDEKETQIHNLKCVVERQERTLNVIQTVIDGELVVSHGVE
jgi:hypothetical protein